MPGPTSHSIGLCGSQNALLLKTRTHGSKLEAEGANWKILLQDTLGPAEASVVCLASGSEAASGGSQ